MALKIDKKEQNGGWLIEVAGEVDLYTSPELRSAVNKVVPKANARLGVDLMNVPYMDSSGVATLVEALRLCNAKNMEFVLVSPSQAVMKVLQLSRLDSVFSIRDTL